MARVPRRNRPPVPDPARSYERAKPEDEAGMGRLNNNQGTPIDEPDRMPETVQNAQPERQINAEQETDQRQVRTPPGAEPPSVLPQQPEHSMLDEEPDGWDLAPTDIHNPRDKRHPRHEGKGGTP